MPTLSTTRNYTDNTTLTEAQLDAAFDSIETFVNTTKLGDDNLAALSVGTDQIQVGAVTTSRIAGDAVTRAKIEEVERTPTGAVMAFAAASAPTGWLICDGTAVSRTTYSTLFGIIGETHGEGDNSTTFNLPDYRGRFLRGRDSATARDPNAATRTAMATGGNTGDNVGSIQDDEFEGHTHTYDIRNVVQIASGSGSFVSGQNYSSSPATSSTGGSTETRPKNAYVTYIIKY
jgi:microcystin-dependent protein